MLVKPYHLVVQTEVATVLEYSPIVLILRAQAVVLLRLAEVMLGRVTEVEVALASALYQQTAMVTEIVMEAVQVEA